MSESNYLMTEELKQAVGMARSLNMPLLLTGEPGVGKSSLARALARQQNLRWFEIKVHSDTRYRDLFYAFDDVGRFSEASLNRALAADSNDYAPLPRGMQPTDPRLFIRFVGLGAAILQAMDRSQPWLDPAIREQDYLPGEASSVVLIDEIDKAPRDVPNDLLVQIDQWRFEVPEFSRLKDYPQQGFALNNDQPRPFVVITSNREKSLPDAFMRRCVYFHIELPPSAAQAGDSDQVTLDDIVVQQLADPLALRDGDASELVRECVAAFGEARSLAEIRKPGLAELLNWVHYIVRHERQPRSVGDLPPDEIRQMLQSLLLKDPADHEKLHNMLREGLDANEFPRLSGWLDRQGTGDAGPAA